MGNRRLGAGVGEQGTAVTVAMTGSPGVLGKGLFCVLTAVVLERVFPCGTVAQN